MSDLYIQKALISALRSELTSIHLSILTHGVAYLHEYSEDNSFSAPKISHKQKAEVLFILTEQGKQFNSFFELQLDRLFNLFTHPSDKNSIEHWQQTNHINTLLNEHPTLFAALNSYMPVSLTPAHYSPEHTHTKPDLTAENLSPKLICIAYLCAVQCCTQNIQSMEYFLLLFKHFFDQRIHAFYSIFELFHKPNTYNLLTVKTFITDFTTITPISNLPCLSLNRLTAQQRTLTHNECSTVTVDSYLYQLQKAQITYIKDHHTELNFLKRDIRPQLFKALHNSAENIIPSTLDSHKIDTVGYIFELLNENTTILTDLKSYLLTLQVFYSRVALKNPAFLHKKNHITRILLIDLIELSERLSHSTHSDYQESMLNVLKDSIFLINETKNITLTQVKHLHSLFHKNLHCDTTQANKTTAPYLSHTPIKKAQHLIADLITTRTQNITYDPTILKLVRDAWFNYLMLTYLQKGPKSKAWRNGVSTLDTLLWCARTVTHESDQAIHHWDSCVSQVRRKIFICLSEIRFNECRLNQLMDTFDQYFVQQKHVITQNT